MATLIVLVNFVWSIAGFVLLWRCRKLLDIKEGKGKEKEKANVAAETEKAEEDTVMIGGQEIGKDDLKKIVAMIEGGK